jgi:hypothetical protein
MIRTGTTLDQEAWNDLITRLRDKRCTPFIGAGASSPALPRAAELAEQLIAEFPDCPLDNDDKKDLLRVTQYLAIRKDNLWPKEAIARIIKGAAPPTESPHEPHRVLAKLKLPVYITTNYDAFMITALRRERPQAVQEFARWTSAMMRADEFKYAFDGRYTPTSEVPVVFHLHGDVRMPEAMVATEVDYLDFIVNTAVDLAAPPKKPMIPHAIRRAITSTSLLFIGYSLNDVNFRIMMHALFKSLDPSARRINIAIQYAGTSADNLKSYMGQYFSKLFNVRVFHGTAHDFTRELAERWSD